MALRTGGTPAIALVASNPVKLVLPEVDKPEKMHVWKINGEYYEDLPAARVAMTDKVMAEFFSINKLKTPTEIAKALAENMRFINERVEQALK